MDELILQTRRENLNEINRILRDTNGIDLNTAKDGRKVLADALEAKKVSVLEAFLECKRVSLDDWIVSYERGLARKQDCISLACIRRLKRKDLDHSTNPIFFAIELESVAKFNLLARNGANLNCRTPNTDMTPLMCACWIGNGAMIRAVVRAGFNYNPNEANKFGKTALDYLGESGKLKDPWFCSKGARRERMGRKKFDLKLLDWLYVNADCFKTRHLTRLLLHVIDEISPEIHFCRLASMESSTTPLKHLTPQMLAIQENFIGRCLLNAACNDLNTQKTTNQHMSAFLYLTECASSMQQFSAMMEHLKVSLPDFKDYLKFSKTNNIARIHAILSRHPEYREIFFDFFKRKDEFWNGFIALFGAGRSWACNEKSLYFREYIKPLIAHENRAHLKYLSHTEKKFDIKKLSSDFQAANVNINDQFTARYMLYLWCITTNNNKSAEWLRNEWMLPISDEWIRKYFELLVEKRVLKGIKILIENGHYKLSQEDKNELAFKLDCREQSFYDFFCRNGVNFDTPNAQGQYPIQFYLQKGWLESAVLCPRPYATSKSSRNTNDEGLVITKMAMKSVTMNSAKKLYVIQKAFFKMEDYLSQDSDGNTIFHLIPQKKYMIELLRRIYGVHCDSKKGFGFLFTIKNRKGLCAFDILLRRKQTLELILSLASFLKFEDFQLFLDNLDHWRPNFFFCLFIRPGFGPLLLHYAKDIFTCTYLVHKYKLSGDYRIVSLYGKVYTPIWEALSQNRERKAKLFLSLNSQELQSCDPVAFCSMITGRRCKSHRFWIKKICKGADEVVTTLRQLLSLCKSISFGLIVCSLLESFDLSTRQWTEIAFLLCSVKEEVCTLEETLKKNADPTMPIDASGRCLIDELVYRRRKIYFDTSVIDPKRILHARCPDNTPVFSGLDWEIVKKDWAGLIDKFPDLERLLYFGFDSLKQFDEVDFLEVLGATDRCCICHGDFQLDEYLSFLPCKHLFHLDCLYAYEIQAKVTQCPYCRAAIGKDDTYTDASSDGE